MKIRQKFILLFSLLITLSVGITGYLIFQYVESSIGSEIKQLDQMMPLKDQSLVMHRNSMLQSESALESLKLPIWISETAIAGGGIWAVFFVSSRITRPLNRLAVACRTQEIDKLKKIDIRTSDETSNVIDSINYLISRISENEKNLRLANEELKIKEIDLERSNNEILLNEKSKDEFISMISHELKTPLVPMKLYSGILLKTKSLGDLNENQTKAIQAIQRNLEKLEVLVNDVMDCYKLELGKLKFSKANIGVPDLINNSLLEIKPFTVEKQIEIKSNVKMTGTVYCDPKRIEQVLSNLLKNSIDFVPQDDGKLTVSAEKGQDSQAVFTVEDNGIGIPAEKIDNLFQKFYQTDTSPTRLHGGTGLGLAICKGIVEAHNGKIWVDKTRIKGTAIKFSLPITGK